MKTSMLAATDMRRRARTTAAGSRSRRRARAGLRSLLYILPALILVVGVIYVGIGYTGWVATLDWNGIDPEPGHVGPANLGKALGDPVLWEALGHVLVFGVITVVVQMAIGLSMALLLSGRSVVARPLYKVIMFLPVVLAPAAVATAFRSIMSPDGSLNGLLRILGIDADIAWLADPHIALFSIALINVWQWSGFSFIMYQAALSQLDGSVFEAAAIDGAGVPRMIRHVLLPQLTGTHATLALVGCIGALKTFDLVYLTTGGGPGRSTEFLTTYIYQQMVEQFNAGYSSALAVVLVVLAMAFTVVQIRLYRYGEDA